MEGVVELSSSRGFRSLPPAGAHVASSSSTLPATFVRDLSCDLSILADVRLDNRGQLAGTLGSSTQSSDAELLLAGYVRWGTGLAERLIGDFAFAIWNARSRELFCARDAIGARTLFYIAEAERLAFSATLPPLMRLSGLKPRVNVREVARLLAQPACIAAPPLLDPLRELAPGQWLLASASRLELRRYWTPEQATRVRHVRVEDYLEEARALLGQAVVDRMPDSEVVGAHCSGGLDSTGVALIAQQQLRARGRTLRGLYSWSPPVGKQDPLGGADDERRRLLGLSESIAVPCRWGQPDPGAKWALLARDCALEGRADLAEELALLETASADGVSVLLSGWGGDEVVTFKAGGYAAWLFRNGRWKELRRLLQYSRRGPRTARQQLGHFMRRVVAPHLPDALYAPLDPRGWQHPIPCFWSAELARAHGDLLHEREPGWREATSPRANQLEMLARGHLGARMSHWAHWGAEHRIRYAYPLTDRRLLEWVIGLPPEILMFDGRRGGLYRRALAHLLPPDLDKRDPANELKRDRITRQCWDMLARDCAAGSFDMHCPWLDMPRVRAVLLEGHERLSSTQLRLNFIGLRAAVRAWRLWQRYGAGC